MEPPRRTASTWSSMVRREANSSNLGSGAGRGISSPVEKSGPTLSKLVFQGEYSSWTFMASVFQAHLLTKVRGAGSNQQMENGSTERAEEGKAIRPRGNAPVLVGRADSSETGFGVR